MDVSGRRSGQEADCKYHDEPWKLKDKVKILMICCNNNANGDEKIQGATPTKKPKQGPKKWMKKDAHLFVHEMPVIRLSPRDTDLTSSTCETIHLDDIVFIKNMSKRFKNNVLAIAFSSCNLLLAFDSKCRRDLWFSEIMCLTDDFTLLLYKCSHPSAKVGYYQMRFILGNLFVYDAITKSTAWKWDISHICGYRFEKASAIRIEIGKESNMDGFFCFTGKNVKSFCQRLQMVGHNIAQKKRSSLCTSIESASAKLEHIPNATYTLPKSKDGYSSQFDCTVSTLHCSVTSPGLEINSECCDSLSITSLDLSPNDTLQCLSSDNTALGTKSIGAWNGYSYNISETTSTSIKSTSTDDEEDYVIPSLYTCDTPSNDHLFSDSYNVSGTTSGNKLKSSISYDDDEEEDYVIPSLYTSDTSLDDYLKLLPPATHEHIQNGHGYD